MQHVFELNGVEHRLWLSRQAGGYILHVDGAKASVSLAGDCLRVSEQESRVYLARDGDRLFIHLDGKACEVVYHDPVLFHAGGTAGSAQDVLKAPMPGAVVSCGVTEGQEVSAGDVLLVIESMKLETALRAPRDGIIEKVHVLAMASFERDAVLVSLVPQDGVA